MKYSELYRLLESNGWQLEQGKRHAKYVHPDIQPPIRVGRHPSQEVPVGMLNAILKSAKLK
ncbi:MAG: type II toxin-antitoxin system HicA family toxin [Tannerella sp.]|nr:type II toxin-antitoxin system HicA family toxin [Tannerella sp.]